MSFTCPADSRPHADSNPANEQQGLPGDEEDESLLFRREKERERTVTGRVKG